MINSGGRLDVYLRHLMWAKLIESTSAPQR